MAHQGGQDALEVHGSGALSHAQHEDVGPRVPDEADLSVVAERPFKTVSQTPVFLVKLFYHCEL